MRIIIPILIVLGSYLYYRWNKNEKRKKEEEWLARQEEIRRQLLEFIDGHLPDIRIAATHFSNRLKNFEAGYFTNYELLTWKNSTSQLYEAIQGKPYESIDLHPKDTDAIKLLLDYFQNAATHRNKYNKEFISQELNHFSAFFDSVEDRKLDIQQRTAIVTDEDNNMVIAGAGSGKTTTIVGKVGYVIKKYNVPPAEILLISFTNKSAATLASRINIPGVEAKTFHKFGKDVIAGTEQRQPSLFDEKQFKNLIAGFFKELLQNNSYLSKVTLYFTDFLKPEKSQDEFKNQGEYFQYMKDQDFTTYKLQEIPHRDRTTYKRELVKSIEECKIANFLLFNNIQYEYESPYEHDTATQTHRQYKPDFTILSNGKKFYLEHFGINKSGMVPHFFADADKGQTVEQATKEYVDGIQWKREQHKHQGTYLIETYSHEMFDNVLFENLSKKLSEAGITLAPKNAEEIWEIIFDAAKEEVDGFINLFQTFISLMKSNSYSIADIQERNKKLDSRYHRKRNLLFMEIITPIYEKYQEYLAVRREIDFSDMINKATYYISVRQYKRKFRYVIIDEFQDISVSRYQLVKAIKNANPDCRLFCVGDDWQSIYRFSGSDIALFKEFENYFGYTETAKIETTYRFHEPLISVSSAFILKNANQIRKDLRSISNTRSSEYKIVYSVSEDQDDTYALYSIFNELSISGKAKGKEIYILGRYSFDIDRLKNKGSILTINKATETVSFTMTTYKGEVSRISAQFMTVHKSKGLEADIIIVLNCNAGKLGFPSGISDDHVLNLLLSEADQFENGEERRLFYVAMTRAKEMVYFVADSVQKSKFITELESDNKDPKIKKCPRCINADLVKKSGVRNGKEWSFYGCSNYIYGCTHQEWL